MYADYLADYYYRNPEAADDIETDDFEAELQRYMRDASENDWETLINDGDNG